MSNLKRILDTAASWLVILCLIGFLGYVAWQVFWACFYGGM